MKNIELNQQSKLDKGTIIEVIGPVVNVQFPSNSLPKIYDALKVKLADGSDLILEVEQLAGDGIVKCISMGSTEGLTRGITVEQTGNPILAPVGEGPSATAEPTANEVASVNDKGNQGGAKTNYFGGDKFRWYVIQAFSGFEQRVALTLAERIKIHHMEDYFGEILVPKEKVKEIKDGKKRESERKFFPGYVLVNMRMTSESWQLVKHTDRVLGFIGGTVEKPLPITEAEANKILNRLNGKQEVNHLRMVW